MVNQWIKFNRDAFKTESPEMFYWLGFIFADGNICVEGNKYRLSISVHVEDREHLRKFVKFMGYEDEKSIPLRKDRCVRVRVNSREVVTDLMKYGITPNKSLTAEPVNVPAEYMKYFILGIFDGDGSFYKSVSRQGKYLCHSTVAEICGSEKVVGEASRYFNDMHGLKTSLHRHGSIWRTYISSAMKIREAFSEIYIDTRSYCLARKYNYFTEEIA